MRPPAEGPVAEEMRQFFGRYGAFLQLWQTYELFLEVMIMRTLRLSAIETSILCGSLNFASKNNILLALLNLKSTNPAGIAALRTAQAAAERNGFVHSFMTHAAHINRMHLVRRDVNAGKYKVVIKHVSKTSMQTHGDNFSIAFSKAAEANGIKESDLDAYVLEIESHAPAAP
jgi:hypothetical protein